jgi:hypothetical protein
VRRPRAANRPAEAQRAKEVVHRVSEQKSHVCTACRGLRQGRWDASHLDRPTAIRAKTRRAPVWRGRHREPAKAGLEWHATAPFRNAFDVHVADYSIVNSTRTRFLWSHVCSRNYC